MVDDVVYKFRLTAEHKAKIKEAFNALIDGQFEAMEGAYMDAFRSLPSGVAESMSPQEAARFVDMVVREAAANITKGAAALQKEVSNVAKDEARMEKIRKEFLGSLGCKEESDG